MRFAGVVVAVVVGVGGVAGAQPGAYPPGGYPPPPGAYPPPPAGPPVVVSPEEYAMAQRGEISGAAMIGGLAANYFFGFGLGQAIQGRWSDTGWIFTVGEVGSLGALIYGVLDAVECEDSDRCDTDRGVALAVGGMIGFGVFRIWSMVDTVAGAKAHNRQVRAARARMGWAPTYSQLAPYVAPTARGEGATAGLSLRF